MTNLYEVTLTEGGTIYINLSHISHFTKSERDGSFMLYPMELCVEAGSFMSARDAAKAGMYRFNKPEFTVEEVKES